MNLISSYRLFVEGILADHHVGCMFYLSYYRLSVNQCLRWLDWIFLGGYLPRLSFSYVGMSKDMGKRLPQLFYIIMKICYDWVLLQSESPWQRNDANTLFIYLCVSLYQEFFFFFFKKLLVQRNTKIKKKRNGVITLPWRLRLQ